MATLTFVAEENICRWWQIGDVVRDDYDRQYRVVDCYRKRRDPVALLELTQVERVKPEYIESWVKVPRPILWKIGGN